MMDTHTMAVTVAALGPFVPVAGIVNWLKIGENFIASLVTTGFLLGALNWWLAKKKAPMERDKTLAEASSVTVNSVLAALESAEQRSIRAERTANKALRQVTILRAAYDALLMFWRHIAGNWDHYRAHPAPPVVPAHALLDTTHWDDDGDEQKDEG